MVAQRGKAIGRSRSGNSHKSGPGISRGLSAQAVLEAAEIVIARQGLATFRIRDVADALDVKSQAIYNYFDGREALIEAVSEKFTGEVIEALTVTETKDPWDEVRLSARNLAIFFCSKPSAAYLALTDIAEWTLTRKNGLPREIDLAYQHHIAEVLAEGAERGIFRPIRVATYFSFVAGGIAANVLWNERHRSRRDGTAVPEAIIQKEAVELVVSLLTPYRTLPEMAALAP